MATKSLSSQLWVSTDLSNEYEDALANFKEPETIRCLEKNIDFLKNLNQHVKIMGEQLSLLDYRIRFQMLIEYSFKKGTMARLVPYLASKMVSVISKKGESKAIEHLTQTVIRFLALNEEIYVKKPVSKRRGKPTPDEKEKLVF